MLPLGLMRSVIDTLSHDSGTTLVSSYFFLLLERVSHVVHRLYRCTYHATSLDAEDDPPNNCSVNYKRDCNSSGQPGCIVSAFTEMVCQSALWLCPSTTTETKLARPDLLQTEKAEVRLERKRL